MMDYETIEKYCKGALSAQELQEFEKKLNSNVELRNEVEIYKESIIPLEQKIKNEDKFHDFKTTLKEVESEFYNNEESISKGRMIGLFKKMIPVVSIAATLVLGIYVFQPKQNLYNQFASHEIISVQTKGSDNLDLKLGVEYYNNKEFSNARVLLEQYLIQHPSDMQIKLILGKTYLETDDYSAALEIFTDEIFVSSMFENKSEWFIALTYLKMKDIKKCIQQLHNIDENSEYYDLSIELLREIE